MIIHSENLLLENNNNNIIIYFFSLSLFFPLIFIKSFRGFLLAVTRDSQRTNFSFQMTWASWKLDYHSSSFHNWELFATRQAVKTLNIAQVDAREEKEKIIDWVKRK